MTINICHVGYNEHKPIFDDVIDSLRSAFCRLGVPHRYSLNYVDPGAINLMIGHVSFIEKRELPPGGLKNTIIFQLESLTEGSLLEKCPYYIELLRQATQIWDYSPTNVAFLNSQGIHTAIHVPIGHDPILERIDHVENRDIDVLFYGAKMPRRTAILQSLINAGYKVEHIFGVYGGKRDGYIARSKIVINIHQFDKQVVEEVRLSYLLANRCFVVSEVADRDPYDGGVVFVPYDKLVETCAHYLNPASKAERDRLAERGHQAIQAYPFWRGVRAALLAKGGFPQLAQERAEWGQYWTTPA
ncbi:hypothetical protein [Paramagnetospirillum magneticum]|nr:hypothetical protein [Paramagnetospirillum magneticum]